MKQCNYFGIKELVSPIVYNKWKEQAWMFFSPLILEDLDTIRETWGSPIIMINKVKKYLKNIAATHN